MAGFGKSATRNAYFKLQVKWSSHTLKRENVQKTEEGILCEVYELSYYLFIFPLI